MQRKREEEEAFELETGVFQARGLPLSHDIPHLVEPIPSEPTAPAPFNLEGEWFHRAAVQAKERDILREEQENLEKRNCRARGASVLRRKAFVPAASDKVRN